MRISIPKKRGKPCLCALALLCASPLASAEWTGNAGLGISRDSNVNNAQLRPDIAGDSASSADLSVTDFFALEDGNSVSVGGAARGEAFSRYTGLNNVSLGAKLDFRKKWALGANAPWTGLSLSSSHLNFSNAIRNGWLHQIALSGGQRIFERWEVRAALQVERRTAASLPPEVPGISGDVFSQASRTATLSAEYAWSDRLFFTFGSLLRRGDVTASTRIAKKIFLSSQAIAEDPVFGPDFYAYKLTASTYGLNIDMDIVLTPQSLLRASVARQLTHAEGGNDYAKSVLMLSWNNNF